MTVWNPWHGCRRVSEGCQYCYMFRRDQSIGKDPTEIARTASFFLPVKRKRDGSFALTEPGTVYACMTSDFFLEDADEWRPAVWDMIRERKDLKFTIITKRLERVAACLPPDWGTGWKNVTLCATCENQRRTDERLPILLDLPLVHRQIIHEPMLEEIEISPYLVSGKIEKVICGGESGPQARLCRFEWILKIREACRTARTDFVFKQTGAYFAKGDRFFSIPRPQQMAQAKKANLNLVFPR